MSLITAIFCRSFSEELKVIVDQSAVDQDVCCIMHCAQTPSVAPYKRSFVPMKHPWCPQQVTIHPDEARLPLLLVWGQGRSRPGALLGEDMNWSTVEHQDV
jgi:hypothetical protein